MELRTNCPTCKDVNNNCFVEKTEVEGKLFESYMCFKCGLTSNSYLAFDSEKLEEYTKSHSQLMNDLKIMDEKRGIVWFPSVINMGELGMIFPESSSNSEGGYDWKYAKVVEIPEGERANYDNHDKRLDVENAMTFSQYEFLKACEEMGITRNMKQDA